jgi:hypothetical protein
MITSDSTWSTEREGSFSGSYRDVQPTITSVKLLPSRPAITTSSATLLDENFKPETALHTFAVTTKATVEAEWRWLSARSGRDPAYEPSRTLLGSELRRLRAKIIRSGQPQLTWEDIEKATAELRGE